MSALDRYTGPWDERRAGHLLRRTTFLSSKQFVGQLVQRGLDGAVEERSRSVHCLIHQLILQQGNHGLPTLHPCKWMVSIGPW
jgi:hypothetical protein